MAKEKIKRGMKRLRPSRIVRNFETREEIILRDYLAMQRTTLANERTLFSYIRTSLYLILGGIGLLEVETFSRLQWAGELALLISAFMLVYGVIRYIALRRKLRKFYNSIGISDKQQSQ
jgi:putative membrane protein